MTEKKATQLKIYNGLKRRVWNSEKCSNIMWFGRKDKKMIKFAIQFAYIIPKHQQQQKNYHYIAHKRKFWNVDFFPKKMSIRRLYSQYFFYFGIMDRICTQRNHFPRKKI